MSALDALPTALRVRLRLAHLGLDALTDVVLAAGMPFNHTFTAMAAFAKSAIEDTRAGRTREADQALSVLRGDNEIPDAVYAAIRDLVAREALARVPVRATRH